VNCTKFPKIQPDKTKWEVVFIPSEPRYRVLEMPPPAPVHRGIFRAFRHFRGAGVYNLSSATESRFRRDPEGVWDLHTFRLYLALAHVLVSPLSEVSILRPKVNTIFLVAWHSEVSPTPNRRSSGVRACAMRPAWDLRPF